MSAERLHLLITVLSGRITAYQFSKNDHSCAETPQRLNYPNLCYKNEGEDYWDSWEKSYISLLVYPLWASLFIFRIMVAYRKEKKKKVGWAWQNQSKFLISHINYCICNIWEWAWLLSLREAVGKGENHPAVRVPGRPWTVHLHPAGQCGKSPGMWFLVQSAWYHQMAISQFPLVFFPSVYSLLLSSSSSISAVKHILLARYIYSDWVKRWDDFQFF